MQPLDVLCMGEALVDFLPDRAGRSVSQVETWHRCVGGSPANVAVGLARLGARAGFLGVVGRDPFGDFLKERLAAEGLDVSRVRQTAEGKTGLVFISLDERGDRSFAMFRTRSSEQFLGEQDVDLEAVRQVRATHSGSNSLLWPAAQAAMLRMMEAARAAGRIVSCDPNLRLHHWPDPAVLRAVLDRLLPLCTLVKLSEEEVEFVTGAKDPGGGLRALAARGVLLPIVTRGEHGAVARWRGRELAVAAPRAKVVDTTGAGDGFVAAMLYGLTRLYDSHSALEAATEEVLLELLRFACGVGAKVTEGLGAVTSLPRRADLAQAWPALLR